jgi:hypothetical protein
MTARGFLQNDNMSQPALCYDSVVTLKLTELRGNVTENKALHFLEWGQSRNVYENKGDSS